MKNGLFYGLILILILVGGFLFFKGSKKLVKPDVTLKESLQATLPQEARDKILINQDKVNLGKQYISTIYITKEDKDAHKIVSDFIYEAYSKIDEDEMKNISAVNIVIYKDNVDKTKTKQYRVLLGAKLAAKKDESFWKKRDPKALFTWLSQECPMTSSVNLLEFCDISSSLKEN